MDGTVYGQFRSAALEVPDAVFLCYPSSGERGYLPDGKEYRYREALRMVDELAAAYAAAGYGAGHRVALFLGNRPEHFWHLLAVNSIGASVVPLNPAYLDHELHYAVAFAECSLVVALREDADRVRRVCSTMAPQVAVAMVFEGLPDIPPPARTAQDASPSQGIREALIIYTSGTTGRPKGCMISNSSCLAAGESYAGAGGLISFRTAQDRLYIPLPAFHMNVSVYTLNTMTRTRNCIVMQDRFRASSWWQDISETGVTCVHYMGIIPPLLVKAEPNEYERRHGVRFGQGAGVDPVVREAFETRFGFPLIEAWGMTETSRAIQNCREPRDASGRAFGYPRSPLEVRIADDDDNPMPPDTAGELLVRCEGPDPRHGFFSGYLKQPAETEKTWRNGWFHTGDIVRQRADGMLFFVDRKKNIVRRSGENIAAAEVEEALIDHPGIRSVAVMAVADDFHDEEIMACVVLIQGNELSSDTAAGICDWAQSRLARHKLPAWIAFVEEIPVTGTQKVQKGAIFPENTDPRRDPRTIDMRSFKRRRETA